MKVSKPVNTPSYWEKRLKDTDKDTLHFSVLVIRKEDFDELTDKHAKALLPYKNKKVLDAGCGYGRMSVYFSDYTGVDISPDFINLAKQKYPKKKFIIGDLKVLPFKDKTFDVAFCVVVKNMTVQSIGEDEWKKIEKELKRVAEEIIILET